MSSKTYKVRALVLKKTKLGEKDLVVSLLAQDGSLVKGVAKGARKPGGSFAARLELFSTVDLLMAKGRSLDIVSDARLVGSSSRDTYSLAKASIAAPLAELLHSVAQPGLPVPRVFDMANAAFDRMLAIDASEDKSLAVLSASLWKVMGQLGFRPSFAHCVLCGSPVPDDRARGSFSVCISDGGVVCDNCRRPADAIVVRADTVRWCEAFIGETYDAVMQMNAGVSDVLDTLQLARTWIAVHTGRHLKSIDFLFTAGILST